MLGLVMNLMFWLGQPGPSPLSFDVLISEGADPTTALPTVVVLHGRDDALHGLADALQTSIDPVRVIVPRGPRVQRNGTHAWFRRSDVHSRGAGTEAVAAACRVAELVARLHDEGLVEGRPIVVGYSQGAVVALELSLIASGAVGEVIAINGHLPPSHLPTQLGDHVGTQMLIGDDDRVMPASTARQQAAHLQALGYPVEIVRLPGQGHVMGPRLRRLAVRRVRAALDTQRPVDPRNFPDTASIPVPTQFDAPRL